jgi:transposase
MITKKQGAAHLNVSEKTIERAVKRGELAAQYTKGANGSIVVLNESELDRFKRERDAILYAPEIVTDEQTAQIALVENRLPTTTDTTDKLILRPF